MSLYKRDNMWWIDFTTASGTPQALCRHEQKGGSAGASRPAQGKELAGLIGWESGGSAHGMRWQRNGSRRRSTSARTMTTCSSCAG